MGGNDFIGSKEWAKWEDLFSQYRKGKYGDWTVIAQADGYEHIELEDFTETFGTFSYLVKNGKRLLQTALSHDEWDVQYGLLSIRISEDRDRPRAFLGLGEDKQIPFISRKSGIYDFQPTWRVNDAFEDYLDLRYNQQGQLVDPRSGEVVVKIPFPASVGPVQVRTDYLQEFLAAFGFALIRQHDHRRHWKQPIPGLHNQGGDDAVVRVPWGCYRYNYTNIGIGGFGQRFSRIVAKDFILPAKKAGLVGRYKGWYKKKFKYPSFIVERKDDGTEVKQRPDKGIFFRVVYFDPRVLKRYYDQPSKYTVHFGSPGLGAVSDVEEWTMPIGLNREGLVFCWLGDITKSHMPESEVTHWHAHHVPPRGLISKDFFDTQLMARFATNISLEDRLRESKRLLCDHFRMDGISIYKPYEGAHKYLEKCLRIPLYNEFPEFRDCVITLSTIFVEQLDIAAIKSQLLPIAYKDANGKILPPLAIFDNFLSKIQDITEMEKKNLVAALRNIQEVRSKTGVAHSLSEETFRKVLVNLGLPESASSSEIFLAIAVPLADALEDICVSLHLEDQLWWRKTS